MAGAALLALALGASAGPAGAEMGADKFKPGDKAPDFTTKDFDGKEYRLSAAAGRNVVLLNFWGRICGACLEEMPYLEEIGKKYGSRGLAIWAVNTDGLVEPKDVEETRRKLRDKVGVSFPLLLDPEFTITDTYTSMLVPLTVIIDRQGTIRYIHTGFEAGLEKEYEAAVKKALGP